MSKQLKTVFKDLADLMDVDNLKDALTNLNEFYDQIKRQGGDPAIAQISFPYDEKPFIEYKRLETDDEYERRSKQEHEREASRRESELVELARLKAKYES